MTRSGAAIEPRMEKSSVRDGGCEKLMFTVLVKLCVAPELMRTGSECFSPRRRLEPALKESVERCRRSSRAARNEALSTSEGENNPQTMLLCVPWSLPPRPSRTREY
eukprot:scaffold3457_cov230-Pinguiococcus_pyrenoidosus.AAC.1